MPPTLQVVGRLAEYDDCVELQLQTDDWYLLPSEIDPQNEVKLWNLKSELHFEPTPQDDKLEESLTSLGEIQSGCKSPGWDGFNARPITQDAISETEKFLRKLPSSVPQPHISPQPNGGIILEWRNEDSSTLIISIRGNAIINYAAVIDSKRDRHGTDEFIDEIPEYFYEQLFPEFVKSM